MWRNIEKSKKNIFSTIFPDCTMIIFDNETNGLGSSAKIIQFSGVKYRINKDLSFTELESIDVYINPEEELPSKITELTGITEEMLDGMPTERELAPKIFEFMESADVWVAYNTPFDLRMLHQMSDRVQYLFEESPSLDVLEMARDLISPDQIENYKLGTITSFLFPDDTTQFHSAIEDVRATAKVFSLLLKGYMKYKGEKKEEKEPIHLEEAHLFINPRKKSQQRLVMVLNQGKKGDIFYDIVLKNWSCKSDSSSKKLFAKIDLEDLERQFLNKYAYKFGMNSMDEVAKSWMKFKREKEKEKKLNMA